MKKLILVLSIFICLIDVSSGQTTMLRARDTLNLKYRIDTTNSTKLRGIDTLNLKYRIDTTNTGKLRATDTVSLSKRINGIDIFLIAGQSNAQGQGDSSLSPTISSGVAYQYYSSTLSSITKDPIGNAATGSAWGAFAIKYYQLTGHKVCFVPTAIASTSQTVAANGGAGTWDTSGTLFSTAVTQVNLAVTALTAAGYTPTIRGVLWSQGEIDAGAITAATLTKATYKTALTTMIANFRTQLRANLPFYIFRTGGAVTQGRIDVTDAQEEVAAADYNTDVVYRGTWDFVSRGLQNGAHYTQAGYNEMGDFGAMNVVIGGDERAISNQYSFVGIGTRKPAYNFHLVGTSYFDGASIFNSSLQVNSTFVPPSSLGTDVGTSTLVFNVGFIKNLNSGNNNDLVVRTNTLSNAVKFQNSTTEAARFAGTTGNLLMGTTTDSPTSAMVNLTSTTKALLIMRMTKTQRNAISSPAAGMMVYQTDNTPGLRVYNGTNWMRFTETAD